MWTRSMERQWEFGDGFREPHVRSQRSQKLLEYKRGRGSLLHACEQLACINTPAMINICTGMLDHGPSTWIEEAWLVL